MKFKYLLKIVLAGLIVSSMLSGCSKKETPQTEYQIVEPIQIAALNGPTGIGMVQLMEDQNNQYNISIYQSPDEIVGKLVSGEMDIACVPSNLAAVLYQKTQKNIQLLGTNTLGVLYIVENGERIERIEDLKGQTLILAGKGSAPEYILDHLLITAGIDPVKDITKEFMANHTDVVSTVLTKSGAIALLPEPHVSIAQSKEENIRVAVDINKTWQNNEALDLPMGVIVANKEFIATKEKDLGIFLDSYKKSVAFVNDSTQEAAVLVAKHKLLPNEELAKEAIPKCNIVFRDAKASRDSLDKFYQILSGVDPKAVGGSVPDEAFYYQK